MSISEYILETIRSDEEFRLDRGRQPGSADAPSVLLLSPVATQPALGTLDRIEHQFALRDEFDSAWAVRPLALSQYRGQLALVLENPGGETLDRLIAGPMGMTQFLRIAVGLATGLTGLHQRRLIHKDLTPAHDVAAFATGQVWLTGFGVASHLPRERQHPAPPESLAGTLAYMAPEQTGRMNRSIDSRSDLYALGVVLYEMLTGCLPFSASDPMEWVHCQIARQAVPPSERRTDVPSVVSAVIFKLPSKTPEDRYQTAAGGEGETGGCFAERNGQRMS